MELPAIECLPLPEILAATGLLAITFAWPGIKETNSSRPIGDVAASNKSENIPSLLNNYAGNVKEYKFILIFHEINNSISTNHAKSTAKSTKKVVIIQCMDSKLSSKT